MAAIPPRKKSLRGFLSSERGNIQKQSLAKIGGAAAAGLLAAVALSQTVDAACTSHSNSVQYNGSGGTMHASSCTGCP